MRNRILAIGLLLSILLLTSIVAKFPLDLPDSENPDSSVPSSDAVADNYGALPLYFEKNLGQTDSQVRYFARAGGYSLFLTENRIAFNLIVDAPEPREAGRPNTERDVRGESEPERPTKTYGLYLDFVGANPSPALNGEALQEGISSYFKGSPDEWVTDVPHFDKVRYTELYPGIDAVFYGNPQQIQYDFIVAPHADPTQIRLKFDPVDSISVADNGDLQLALGERVLTMNAPQTYQVVEGMHRAVQSRFVLDDADVTIELGEYDTSLPLVIDPVFAYAGYIGGSDWDMSWGIAVDSAGNAYITGETHSDLSNFPVTVGPDLTYNSGSWDAFVAKIDSSGTALVYAGYIGGIGTEEGQAIAVDTDGNAYVTGAVQYSGLYPIEFPAIGGPDLTYNGSNDAFVVKVNAAGTALVYAGFIGGSGADLSYGIAVDSNSNAYIAGYTTSTQASFPVTIGPDLTPNGYEDAFIAKVNASGTSLVYAGYIGGNSDDRGFDIAVDTNGNAYVTGQTHSNEVTFPIVGGPDLTFSGTSDAFVAKVNTAGIALDYAGYIGGIGGEYGTGIAVDTNANAYVTGGTPWNAFITKVNASGLAQVYTYSFGGNGNDSGESIAVDTNGNAYITGYTDSGTAFPATGGPDLTYNGGTYDAFVAKLNGAGTSLIYASFIGGSGADMGYDIAVDLNGYAYVTGYTASSEASFPVTSGPDLTFNGAPYDAFIAKIGDGPPPDINIESVLVRQPDIPSGNLITLPTMKTFDGNPVHFTVGLTNTFATSESLSLNLVWNSTVLETESFTLSPGTPQNISVTWDTINRAWTGSGDPAAPYDLDLQVVNAGGTVLDETPVTITIRPRPVVLVHGWRGDEHGWDAYLGYIQAENPEWIGLAADNLSTGDASGAFQDAEWNANRLDEFISAQRNALDAQHIDLIGHSMGGLISRAYLHNQVQPNAVDGRPIVFRLLTLGTPHLGSPCGDIGTVLSQLPGQAASSLDGAWHFTPLYMLFFNSRITNTKGTSLSALAGTSIWTCGTPGDVVVPYVSALAYGINNQLAILAFHVPVSGFDYVTSENRFTDFVLPRLSEEWTGAARNTSLPLPLSRDESAAPPVTQSLSVNVPAGQTVNQSVTAIGSGGFGVMFAPTQGLTAELRDSSNTLIASLDAASMSGLPLPTLPHENAIAGIYTIQLTNAGGTDLVVPLVVFEDGLVQELTIDATADAVGILVKATVTDTGVRVVGTTVTAEIDLVDVDEPAQTITLFDDGLHSDGAANDGMYGARYTPPYGGLYIIVVTAQTSGVSMTKATVIEAESTSQLTNGGFETAGSTSRAAQAWKGTGLLTKDRRLCSTITKPIGTAEGTCVFQFSGGSVTGTSRKLKQTVNASGWGNTGESLTFSAQITGKKFGTGAKLTLKVTYMDDTTETVKVAIPAGTYVFTITSSSLPLPKPLKSVTISFDIKKASGRLRVDDVQLILSTASRSNGASPLPLHASSPDSFRGAN